MAKLSFISLKCIHDTEENIIFTNRKCVTMYLRSTMQGKTEFFQERQFRLVCLGISLW